jgi:hypothetical protein
MYESTPEILRVLGRHDPIEGPILNLWVMTTAFMVGAQQLPQPQRDAILDDFHLQSYGTLLKSGRMTESQIMDMQKRLRQRYQEYEESYPRLFDGPRLGYMSFDFVRLVLRHVFRRIGQKALEPDPEIAMAIMSCVHHFHIAALQMVRELLSKNTSLEDWIIASATATNDIPGRST